MTQQDPTMTTERSGPLDPAEREKRIGEVIEFFQRLNKSLKTIGLYRHNTARYGEYLQGAYDYFAELLGRVQSITFVVEQTALKYLGEVVYQSEASDQNLAFKFYQDGIRMLAFREGLTPQEMLGFILICLTNFKAGEAPGEDMVSLMWKADFEHLEYVVMETYSLGMAGQSPEEVQIEVDQIINYLYRSLTTKSEDSFQFARLSLDDLELELDDVDQVAGVTTRAGIVSQETKDEIQQHLTDDEQQRMFARLTDLLMDVLEEELDQELAGTLADAFGMLVDTYLLGENLLGIERILQSFAKLSQRRLPPESYMWGQRIYERLALMLGDPTRIDRMGEVLESPAHDDQHELVHRNLIRAGSAAVPHILETLERLNRPEARSLLCDVLVELGKDKIDLFVARLESKQANLVRDMLSILDRLNPPDKLRIVAQLLRHPNLAIRIEALKTVGGSGDASAGPYISRAIRDKDPQVRMTAARLMANFDPAMAKRSLMAVVQEPEFDERADAEQAAFYQGLAMLNDPESMEYLRNELRSSSLIGRKKLSSQKKNIITGMANSGSIAVYRLLKSELEAGVKDKEVAAVMERACKRLKDRLLGA
ncbi:MAG: HEAT repeat domain-containing protein [Deltaproteobacteria bacterium]|nr:HEAT repeat domain-containing protein [Deltaproteobacteria bacterium]